MLNNDLLVLRSVISKIKIGKLDNDLLRSFIKLSVALNKLNVDFETRRNELAQEAAEAKGYNLQTLTSDQNNELVNIISPILNEFLVQETNLDTKIFTWEELCDSILNNPENTNLSVDEKTSLSQMLCRDDL